MLGFLKRLFQRSPRIQIQPSFIVLHNNNPDLSITIHAPRTEGQLIPPLTNGIAPVSHFLSDDGRLHITIGKVIETEDTLGAQVQRLRDARTTPPVDESGLRTLPFKKPVQE